jgi:hypothetical protein
VLIKSLLVTGLVIHCLLLCMGVEQETFFCSLNTVSLYSIAHHVRISKGNTAKPEVFTERPTVLVCHSVDGSETLKQLVTRNCAKPKCFKILLFSCLKLMFVLQLSVIFCFSSV